MDKKELETILADHAKWLSGQGGSRADLSWRYLGDADLRDVNLSRACLSGAYLSGAYLSRACLRGADLSHVDLREADLREANLSFSNLREANLSRACLSEADLSRANLSGNHYVIGCTLSNYPLVAFMQDNLLCVTSGCRRGLTIAEAREHWSPDNKDAWTENNEAWGAQRLRMIDFLESEAKHLGWIK